MARYEVMPNKDEPWVLKPHRDEGVCTMLMALRPGDTKGGELVFGTAEGDRFKWTGPQETTVDERFVERLHQNHGEILKFHGHLHDYYATPLAFGTRYVLGMFFVKED